jgi:hypothetical protein
MHPKNLIKVYITKHALSKGILEAEAEHTYGDCISITEESFEKLGSHYDLGTSFGKPDWHTNKSDAVKQANYMKEKMILSLKNKILKLENTRFFRSFIK